MAGWCVVLKKETRSKRMNSTEEEHSLGQERSTDDFQVLANMETHRSATREDNAVNESHGHESIGRRRCWDEV